jgi:hypothetical protein
MTFTGIALRGFPGAASGSDSASPFAKPQTAARQGLSERLGLAIAPPSKRLKGTLNCTPQRFTREL